MKAAAPQEHEETQELNARQMEEGDLFGIRAIQSGYFGGVAQSRPVSPTGSTASNPFQTPASPGLVPASPNSSVNDLPLLQVRQPSPAPSLLGMPKGFVLRSDSTRVLSPIPRHLSPRPHLRPLQPSGAELSGRINHDPVVNMSIGNPLSPPLLSPTSPNETSSGRNRPSSPLRPSFSPRPGRRGEVVRSDSRNGDRPPSPLRHYQPSLPTDAQNHRAASPLRHYEPTHPSKDTSSSESSALHNGLQTYDSGSDSPTMGSSISSNAESSMSSIGSRSPSPPSSPSCLPPTKSPSHFDRDEADTNSVKLPPPLRLAPGRETLYYQSAWEMCPPEVGARSEMGGDCKLDEQIDKINPIRRVFDYSSDAKTAMNRSVRIPVAILQVPHCLTKLRTLSMRSIQRWTVCRNNRKLSQVVPWNVVVNNSVRYQTCSLVLTDTAGYIPALSAGYMA